jgi:hypothetical protein
MPGRDEDDSEDSREEEDDGDRTTQPRTCHHLCEQLLAGWKGVQVVLEGPVMQTGK